MILLIYNGAWTETGFLLGSIVHGYMHVVFYW
jgi:hypothetical protein